MQTTETSRWRDKKRDWLPSCGPQLLMTPQSLFNEFIAKSEIPKQFNLLKPGGAHRPSHDATLHDGNAVFRDPRSCRDAPETKLRLSAESRSLRGDTLRRVRLTPGRSTLMTA